MKRCEEEQTAAENAKLKSRATYIPPMISHLLLATSPSPTKSSCNRQEEGKNPTSSSCIPVNRANHEQTLRLHMYEPLRVQDRLATGKGTISFFYLQEGRHSSQSQTMESSFPRHQLASLRTQCLSSKNCRGRRMTPAQGTIMWTNKRQCALSTLSPHLQDGDI